MCVEYCLRGYYEDDICNIAKSNALENDKGGFIWRENNMAQCFIIVKKCAINMHVYVRIEDVSIAVNALIRHFAHQLCIDTKVRTNHLLILSAH